MRVPDLLKQVFRIGRRPRRPVRSRLVEFHLRSEFRDRYDLDDSIFSSTGNIVLADFRAAQEIAERFNEDRPEHLRISAADLNAAALMDELLHYAVARYREDVEPDVIERVLTELDDEFGSQAVDRMLTDFLTLFPNTEIYRSRTTPQEYLSGSTLAIPNRVLTLEELLVGRLCNDNPAYEPFRPLIRDEELREDPLYERVVEAFSRPSKSVRTEKRTGRSLLDVLTEPARRAPYSLAAQLAFVRDAWSARISAFWADRLAMAAGLLAEEQHALELRGFGGGPGPVQAPIFSHEWEEENFSPDVDWMPRVVMVAKNVLVWMDQLSRKYGREISQLDEIPEEEISQLARWGFNALWLIGVWQRSSASQTLKEWAGNPEAAPSAYALYDYAIAEELGGEGALQRFSSLCRRYGIRLASDMVPNHTGIDSKWVREHPDWFVQLPYSPFPSYRYSGHSVADDVAPIIQIEDRYFDRSDAAVTFRYQDRGSGRERFIYHGNDGTGMPWNDTAQLDFVRSDVREAVIRTIIHVARLFPIIRFDAAMVLTKKHFQRLWYPEPGSGDGVPSRAAHGMKRTEFDRRMPNEFWREVVDRVAQEVPDTLLLAEAFWLLEGYFVRTLGMHRVYNSAFMHMLKNEDNAEYRDVVKKTVAFEPEVLKRYVNFMSNPDEETAVEQFGDGDKYFGVCILMLTLPGLPMFGHGQIQGFREKYGMEYRRAYLDEQPRSDLIARHEREIVPVAAKRYLFAEVKNFRLFDFDLGSGDIDENVFAFTNRSGDERALVLYNNRFESTRGKVRRQALDADQTLHPASIVQALGLRPGPGDVIRFRDLISGSEFLVTATQMTTEGVPVQLRGYEYRVLTDFAIVADEDGALASLAGQLMGSGVPDLEEARSKQHLKPVVSALTAIAHAALFTAPDRETEDIDLLAGERIGLDADSFHDLTVEIGRSVRVLARLSEVGDRFPWKRSSRYRAALDLVASSLGPGAPAKAVLVAGRLVSAMNDLDVVEVHPLAEGVIAGLGLAGPDEAPIIVGIAEGLQNLNQAPAQVIRPIEPFISLVSSERIQDALDVHEFGGTVYFNKERFETFSAAAFCEGVLLEVDEGGRETARHIAQHYDAYRRLLRLMNESDYVWTELERRITNIRRHRSAPE